MCVICWTGFKNQEKSQYSLLESWGAHKFHQSNANAPRVGELLQSIFFTSPTPDCLVKVKAHEKRKALNNTV